MPRINAKQNQTGKNEFTTQELTQQHFKRSEQMTIVDRAIVFEDPSWTSPLLLQRANTPPDVPATTEV